MQYCELITEAKRLLAGTCAEGIDEHVAIQFDVIGNASGTFYVEVCDQCIYVEPYEYIDKHAVITGCAESILDLMSGRMSLARSLMEERICVRGCCSKVELLPKLFRVAQ